MVGRRNPGVPEATGLFTHRNGLGYGSLLAQRNRTRMDSDYCLGDSSSYLSELCSVAAESAESDVGSAGVDAAQGAAVSSTGSGGAGAP